VNTNENGVGLEIQPVLGAGSEPRPSINSRPPSKPNLPPIASSAL